MDDLGQMFLAGFDGLTVGPGHPVVTAIRRDRLGGVILFDRSIDGSRQNIASPSQLAELTAALQEHAETPLLVAVDQEGGQVRRLKEEDGFPPSVSAVSLSVSPAAEAEAGMDGMAAVLAEHGINFNLAPVVDLATNPENPIISRFDRSFGREPDLVARLAARFVQAHHRHGVACCLKHFPGHGSASEDSHLGFVDITDSWRQEELDPFGNLIDAGLADAVMTAHVVHRGLDPAGLPATLSGEMLARLLRRRLGFTGPVVSDDLQMKAISKRWNLEEAVQMSVLAGVDLIIVGNNLAREEDVTTRGIRAIERLLEEGRIEKERLAASLARIRTLKEKIAGRKAWKEKKPTA